MTNDAPARFADPVPASLLWTRHPRAYAVAMLGELTLAADDLAMRLDDASVLRGNASQLILATIRDNAGNLRREYIGTPTELAPLILDDARTLDAREPRTAPHTVGFASA